jgi:hypothetical protein
VVSTNSGAGEGAVLPQPVETIGLIARQVGDQIRIFDSITNQEVQDVAAHQLLAQQKQEKAELVHDVN